MNYRIGDGIPRSCAIINSLTTSRSLCNAYASHQAPRCTTPAACADHLVARSPSCSANASDQAPRCNTPATCTLARGNGAAPTRAAALSRLPGSTRSAAWPRREAKTVLGGLPLACAAHTPRTRRHNATLQRPARSQEPVAPLPREPRSAASRGSTRIAARPRREATTVHCGLPLPGTTATIQARNTAAGASLFKMAMLGVQGRGDTPSPRSWPALPRLSTGGGPTCGAGQRSARRAA